MVLLIWWGPYPVSMVAGPFGSTPASASVLLVTAVAVAAPGLVRLAVIGLAAAGQLDVRPLLAVALGSVLLLGVRR